MTMDPSRHKNEQKEKNKIPKLYPFAIIMSLLAGCACIGASIVRSWPATATPTATPVLFDWFLLSMGVLLCGFSVLKSFSPPKLIKAEFQDFLSAQFKDFLSQNTKNHQSLEEKLEQKLEENLKPVNQDLSSAKKHIEELAELIQKKN